MAKKKVPYSVPEAAELLAIGKSKMWELVMTGQIDSVTIGRSRRITRQAIEAFVTSLEGDAA